MNKLNKNAIKWLIKFAYVSLSLSIAEQRGEEDPSHFFFKINKKIEMYGVHIFLLLKMFLIYFFVLFYFLDHYLV